MAPTARLPPKKDVALALLEQASMYIHLDPRVSSVQVPQSFKNQPQLVLQVGLNMAVAIPDLHVDDQGLSCTLSFNRTPFFCMIPWPAVFALVGENGQAMVWAEDVPAEVAAQAQAQKAPEKPRPHLRSVGEGEGETGAPPAARAEPAQPAEKKLAGKAGKVPAKPAAAKAEGSKGSAKSKPEPKGVAPKAKPAGKTPGKSASKAGKGAPAEAAQGKKPAAPAPAAKPQPAAARQAVPAKKAPKPEAARSTTEMNKPKRELPPYLRVVK
ncbi:MAG TPA: ClpXP protease specificity-enhancing factor SspB [Polyangiaceae bacterium]|nr:ClpXP protease specificity-enhancing factor SspB [Polyangiaceae bacterium]